MGCNPTVILPALKMVPAAHVLSEDETEFLPITTTAYHYLSGTPFKALATGLPPQRKSAAKFWRIFGGGLILFLLLPLILTFGVTGFLQGDTREAFLSLMTIWLGLAYPFVLVALLYWAWQRVTHRPRPSPVPS